MSCHPQKSLKNPRQNDAREKTLPTILPLHSTLGFQHYRKKFNLTLKNNNKKRLEHIQSRVLPTTIY